MYTCGPSTYMRPHIGNYRTFLFEDVLQRYLEYLGYKVTRLITLTDIEDKAIEQAKKEKRSVAEITQQNEALFFKDFELLKIKAPDYAVRASTVIDQAATLIQELIEEDYAYWHLHKGATNLYFDPLKFEGFGKLAHLDMTKWPKKKRRFHKDTYAGTPWNKGDFILWHGCKKDDIICWDTEIGRGRPAWNIQDAAIVTRHLGFTIDVACGGVDNLVRHHDYTIAIVESISCLEFAKYWLHGGHLLVDGKKMSKSKGNICYPQDFLEKGFTAVHLRFFLIYKNYRRKLNFALNKLSEASQKLDNLKKMVQNLQKAEKGLSSNSSSKNEKAIAESIISDFEAHMNNDLDVKAAFDKIYVAVDRLDALARSGLLSSDTATVALSNLRGIDAVLKIIF